MQNSIQIAYTPYRTEHDGSDRLINGVEAVMTAMKNVLKYMKSGYGAWQEKREAARATLQKQLMAGSGIPILRPR